MAHDAPFPYRATVRTCQSDRVVEAVRFTQTRQLFIFTRLEYTDEAAGMVMKLSRFSPSRTVTGVSVEEYVRQCVLEVALGVGLAMEKFQIGPVRTPASSYASARQYITSPGSAPKPMSEIILASPESVSRNCKLSGLTTDAYM